MYVDQEYEPPHRHSHDCGCESELHRLRQDLEKERRERDQYWERLIWTGVKCLGIWLAWTAITFHWSIPVLLGVAIAACYRAGRIALGVLFALLVAFIYFAS